MFEQPDVSINSHLLRSLNLLLMCTPRVLDVQLPAMLGFRSHERHMNPKSWIQKLPGFPIPCPQPICGVSSVLFLRDESIKQVWDTDLTLM